MDETYIKKAVYLYGKYYDIINDMEIIPGPILDPFIFGIHVAAENERDRIKKHFHLINPQ